MKFKSIEKVREDRFITRYDVTYETELGNLKKYEMISRDSNLSDISGLTRKNKPDAVVIIAHSEDGSKILLNKEFRMPVGEPVYNFPAGLIDPEDKDITSAAARELWEETGLKLTSVDAYLPESYSAVGFTNETSCVLICKASGDFQASTSDEEEIEAGWFSKEEIISMLKTEPFASRTQTYCWMWANS